MVLGQPRAGAQDHDMPAGHEGMDMPMDHTMQHAMPENIHEPTAAELLSYKRESEFNHHLAGFLVVLAGIFLLTQNYLAKCWPNVAYAWPACFLLAGFFLLVFSDTELWPFGPQSWLYGLRQHAEVRQHKIYAMILLGVGVVEGLRTSGRLKSAWAAWVFPVLAAAGSILLLFHQHSGGMHGADHMERMARIQSEHLSYAITGLGIGLAKALSEMPVNWRSAFSRIWPTLMILLGVLLMFYRE